MSKMSESAHRENMLSAIRAGNNRPDLRDALLLDRALGILHRLGTENTGWFAMISRWAYSDEPLRNDAANLVREAGFELPLPHDQRLVGDVSGGKQP